MTINAEMLQPLSSCVDKAKQVDFTGIKVELSDRAV
jgi:hypothetical protein